DEHDALVGGSIAAHHGEIVKSTGDGYMAAFRRAGDAVGAAAEIQRLIARRNEGSEVELGVRVGISAGDVTERAGDYHGVAGVEGGGLGRGRKRGRSRRVGGGPWVGGSPPHPRFWGSGRARPKGPPAGPCRSGPLVR